jgi:multiple sugar transport system substrate-binding protein
MQRLSALAIFWRVCPAFVQRSNFHVTYANHVKKESDEMPGMSVAMSGSVRAKLRVLVVGFVLAALVIAGCAPAAPGAPAESAPAESAAAEAEPEAQIEEMGTGSIVVDMWDGIGASDGEILTKMLNQCVTEHPDVKVKRQIISWDIYFDKLATAIVAGSGGPDLFVLWHSVMPQYAESGYLRPLAQEMFDEGMLPIEDYSPELLNALKQEGVIWTVPFDNYGVGVYVNLDLLEQAGIDPNAPPKDATEWLEYARRLTVDANGVHPGEDGFDINNVKQWGWGIGWPRATVQPALYQWGSDIISRDGEPAVLINNEASKAATQFFVDAVHTHNVAPKPEGVNYNELFANNQLAMLPDGSWMYNFMNQLEGMRIALWPYPRLGPERGATIMWSHTFAAPATLEGDELNAVKRIVKCLSDNSQTWTEQAGMPTARLSLRAGLEDKVWTLPTFDQQFRAEGVPEFSSVRFSEIMGAVEPAWSAALNNDEPVDQALDQAAQRIERALQR